MLRIHRIAGCLRHPAMQEALDDSAVMRQFAALQLHHAC
jgi:hypothetical protein